MKNSKKNRKTQPILTDSEQQKELGVKLAKNLLLEINLGNKEEKLETKDNVSVSSDDSSDNLLIEVSSSENNEEEEEDDDDDNYVEDQSPVKKEKGEEEDDDDNYVEDQSPVKKEKGAKKNKNKVLLEKIPQRKNLYWSKINKIRKPLYLFQDDVVPNESKDLIYCYSHWDFVLKSGTDIEHLLPLKQLMKRAESLLNYLNNNSTVAEAFMSVEGIGNYFGYNPNKQLRGTKDFYLACYNQWENLWLLCHACNLKKSSLKKYYTKNKGIEDWFKDTSFLGEPFIEAINKDGGIHHGVLFDLVYKGEKTEKFEMLKCELLDCKNIKDESKICGIGTFTRKWLKDNQKERFELWKKMENDIKIPLKEKLIKLEKYKYKDFPKYKKSYVKETKKLSQASAILDTSPYSSDEDDENSEKLRKNITKQTLTQANIATHYLNKLKNKLKKNKNVKNVDETVDNWYLALNNEILITLQEKDWEKIMTIVDKINGDKDTNDLGETDFLAHIFNSLEDHISSNINWIPREQWLLEKKEYDELLQNSKKTIDKLENEKKLETLKLKSKSMEGEKEICARDIIIDEQNRKLKKLEKEAQKAKREVEEGKIKTQKLKQKIEEEKEKTRKLKQKIEEVEKEAQETEEKNEKAFSEISTLRLEIIHEKCIAAKSEEEAQKLKIEKDKEIDSLKEQIQELKKDLEKKNQGSPKELSANLSASNFFEGSKKSGNEISSKNKVLRKKNSQSKNK